MMEKRSSDEKYRRWRTFIYINIFSRVMPSRACHRFAANLRQTRSSHPVEFWSITASSDEFLSAGNWRLFTRPYLSLKLFGRVDTSEQRVSAEASGDFQVFRSTVYVYTRKRFERQWPRALVLDYVHRGRTVHLHSPGLVQRPVSRGLHCVVVLQ